MSGSASEAGTQPHVADILLESGGVSVERLPMLKVVVDRLTGFCAEGIRQLTAAPVYMLTKEITAGRLGQILDPYQHRTVVSVHHVAEWDARLLIGIDADFVFTLLEVLFGGDGSEPQFRDERALTNIELKVAQRALDVTTTAFRAAMSTLTELTLRHERTETKLEFAIAGRRNHSGILARIHLQIFDRGGELFVVIPQQAINPLRELLDKDIAKPVAASDPRWSQKFEKELNRTRVRLRAVVDARESTLGEIGAWKVGDLLKLPDLTDGVIRIECEGQSIFHCELGRNEERYTVRLGEPVEAADSFTGSSGQ